MEKIKFVNHGFPKDSEIGVVTQTAQFIQRSDTMDEDRYQQLNFETCGLEFDEKDNTDAFIRVSTGDPNGMDPEHTDIAPFWSCNGPEEIVELFNIFAQRCGMTCRWKLEKYYVDK